MYTWHFVQQQQKHHLYVLSYKRWHLRVISNEHFPSLLRDKRDKLKSVAVEISYIMQTNLPYTNSTNDWNRYNTVFFKKGFSRSREYQKPQISLDTMSNDWNEKNSKTLQNHNMFTCNKVCLDIWKKLGAPENIPNRPTISSKFLQ